MNQLKEKNIIKQILVWIKANIGSYQPIVIKLLIESIIYLLNNNNLDNNNKEDTLH